MSHGCGVTEDGHVVRFRSATHEVDLTSVGSDGVGYSFARLLQMCSRAAPPTVSTRRIPEVAIENGDHPFTNFGANRCRSRVIKVNQRYVFPVGGRVRAGVSPRWSPSYVGQLTE